MSCTTSSHVIWKIDVPPISPVNSWRRKNHPKRRIVLSKTIEAQTVWRNRNPTIPPHTDLGKAEVSYITFTNTFIPFITDIVQVFKPMPHSNKGCIPMTFPVKKSSIWFQYSFVLHTCTDWWWCVYIIKGVSPSVVWTFHIGLNSPGFLF